MHQTANQQKLKSAKLECYVVHMYVHLTTEYSKIHVHVCYQ